MIEFVKETSKSIAVYRDGEHGIVILRSYGDNWALDQTSPDEYITAQELRQIADKLDELNK